MLTESNNTCGCMEFNNSKDYSAGAFRYCVQLGTFRSYNKAMELQLELMKTGWISDIEKQGDLFAVYTGDCEEIDAAALLERSLRYMGYNPLVVAIELKNNV